VAVLKVKQADGTYLPVVSGPQGPTAYVVQPTAPAYVHDLLWMDSDEEYTPETGGGGGETVTVVESESVKGDAVQRIAVPSYIYPTYAAGGDWERMQSKAPYAEICIINPASGPGTSSGWDFDQYTIQTAHAKAAGLKVLGYVRTNYAAQPAATVKSEIDKYYSWYGVDGIFLDEAASAVGSVPYYADLYAYIKTKDVSSTVIINPGVSAIDEGYMATCDIVMNFENTATAYLSATFPAWTINYETKRFWHCVHTVDDETQRDALLSKSITNRAGYVYFTPDVAPNQYDTLPADPFWTNFVNSLKGTGAKGADGLPGADGPMGPPGTAYLSAQWTFNQNTAVSPASGTMRMNATTYAAATTLWVHETDRDGLDRTLGLNLAVAGNQIIMQSAQGRALWNITAVADSGVYRTFTVTLVETSGTRPSASSPTTLYFTATGTTASVILSGTATPTGATGAVGDYYLDTDDRVLYGPKIPLTALSGHTTQTPTDLAYDAGAPTSWGRQFTFAVAGTITGLMHYRVPTAVLTARTMRVWTLGRALLGSASSAGESGSGWKTITLGTPIAVTAGQTLLIVLDDATREKVPRLSIPAGVPVVNGSITMDSSTYYEQFNPGAFPDDFAGNFDSFIDVSFAPTVFDQWPVALKSAPLVGAWGQWSGNQAAYDAIGTKDPNTLYVVI
jgi:hypothetical protein